MSASKWGQGRDSALSPGPSFQTSGTNPVIFFVNTEDFDVTTLQLVIEDGNVTGAWTIDGSNDYIENGWAGQPANAGHWTPITPGAFPNLFTPALAAVAGVYPTSTGNQGITGFKFGWRTLRITFTPATGASHISVYAFAKASN